MTTATDTTYIITQDPWHHDEDDSADEQNCPSERGTADNPNTVDTYLDERIDIPDADSVCITMLVMLIDIRDACGKTLHNLWLAKIIG